MEEFVKLVLVRQDSEKEEGCELPSINLENLKKQGKVLFDNLNSSVEIIYNEICNRVQTHSSSNEKSSRESPTSSQGVEKPIIPSNGANLFMEALQQCRKNLKMEALNVEQIIYKKKEVPICTVAEKIIVKSHLVDSKTKCSLKIRPLLFNTNHLSYRDFIEKILNRHHIQNEKEINVFYKQTSKTLPIFDDTTLAKFLEKRGESIEGERLLGGSARIVKESRERELKSARLLTVFVETSFDPLNTLDRKSLFNGVNEVVLPKNPSLISSEGKKHKFVEFIHRYDEKEEQFERVDKRFRSISKPQKLEGEISKETLFSFFSHTKKKLNSTSLIHKRPARGGEGATQALPSKSKSTELHFKPHQSTLPKTPHILPKLYLVPEGKELNLKNRNSSADTSFDSNSDEFQVISGESESGDNIYKKISFSLSSKVSRKSIEIKILTK